PKREEAGESEGIEVGRLKIRDLAACALAAELVDDDFEEFVDGREHARGGLKRALVFHEVGHFFVEGHAADGVALRAHELLDASLVVDAGSRAGNRLADSADGAGKESAER